MFLTIKLCTELFEIELTICIKMDLVLNNLQRLICHKTQPTTSLEEQGWRKRSYLLKDGNKKWVKKDSGFGFFV